MSKTTPMMEQYNRIKKKHNNAILFFRLGDFYEMFNKDAHEVSSILNITLTKRHGYPMCGIPYHAAKSYIFRLIKEGKKIAICEQISLPENGKGIAERKVVEIITPGTVVDENFLEQDRNNYLCAIGKYSSSLSFSFTDLSTGNFYTSSTDWEKRNDFLRKELLRLKPSEILIQETLIEDDDVIRNIINENSGLMINRFPDWVFEITSSLEKLKTKFNVINLKGFGIEDNFPGIVSAGVIINYLEDTSKSLLPHITSLNLYSEDNFLSLDESTQRNLEIVHNLRDNTIHYSLLDILNHTRTSMGSRKLRNWLLFPLVKRKEIIKRQEKVEVLYRNQILLSSIRELLGKILDIERLSAKVGMDKANAKDLMAIKNSLHYVLSIEKLLSEWNLLETFWFKSKNTIAEMFRLLDESIKEEPSVLINEGNLIKRGYNPELDNLLELKNNSQKILSKYLESEKKNTGIPLLKIKYNKIIGHFLEVTKSNLHLVPEYFSRRQSLVNAERFTTEKLIKYEVDLNNAVNKTVELEKEIFLEIRNRIKKEIPVLLETSSYIARLDTLQCLSYTATINGYTKPVISTKKIIRIIDGRHPVVEKHIPPGEFVPNNISISNNSTSFALITGPNMAGKSTYLRQVALIVLLSQIGSFVPAREAEIGCVDKIFCRVGASDNLARGESTFLVEMNETANILRSATDSSLIIMDEVGRGTSTNDGLSIAWATSEYILDKVKAKTLFATHYHELTKINHKKLTNLSLKVVEKEGEIVFLKTVQNKPSNNSYGIHVGKLAGLPQEVIQRAKEIQDQIQNLERESVSCKAKDLLSPVQEELFDKNDLIIKEIESLNLDTLTPISAINLIDRWKKEIK